MKELTILEQMILSAILNLGKNAYGVSVRQTVRKLIGKKMNYGTLYNALDQLLRKGYVTKSKGDSSAERIGRPRIHYSLTPAGEKALGEAYQLQATIWENIPDYIKEYKP
ncbi:MAG: helix-turn-helix transcriptional regulator [Candidatus Aminicenantes bacterium]|nr:helix-turn-helix transcriptional regulator [Candidatus Aminicenantes bacterium]